MRRRRPMEPTIIDRVPDLIRKVLQYSKGEARGWAMELAGVLNQTDPCSRCGGQGIHAKHLNCNHDCHDAYCNGCNELVGCRKCGATGRIMKPVVAST